MTVIPFGERKHAQSERETVYKWIRKKLKMAYSNGFIQPKDERTADNEYSIKHVVRLLKEKKGDGKAVFYFRNAKDYITLSPNGQLNVRGGEEGLFKPWGRSEFKDFNPHSIFQELENEIKGISFIPASSNGVYSFGSYSEFINWLFKK
jgi:hypothetical protein